MLRRRSIWDEMERMQQEMDAMFAGLFPGFGKQPLLESKEGYRPAMCNSCETESQYLVDVELPGADKKDIQVNVTDGGVEVKVEQKEEKKEKDSYSKSYMGFYRFFPLPENADKKNINAEYKNGVLRLSIPKLEIEKEDRKQIDVK